MYLDSPLRDHNLLQAIARTNRVADDKKRFGLIVDYIGITRKLDEALEAYRKEDVEHAMRDLEVERDALRQAHRDLFRMVGVKRHTGRLDDEYDALIAELGTEDAWYTFRRKADAFIRAYESLSPDPAVLDYREDLKWVVEFIRYATPFIEKEPPPDLSGVSAKIRRLLEEHLEVTGLKTVVKIRHITDPDFWADFQTDQPAKELRQATIRKATELKRITYDKVQANPLRYETFSERVLEGIRKFEEGQLAAAEALKEFEQIAKDLQAEDLAHEASGLSERAYGVLKILEALQEAEGAEPGGGRPHGRHRARRAGGCRRDRPRPAGTARPGDRPDLQRRRAGARRVAPEGACSEGAPTGCAVPGPPERVRGHAVARGRGPRRAVRASPLREAPGGLRSEARAHRHHRSADPHLRGARERACPADAHRGHPGPGRGRRARAHRP